MEKVLSQAEIDALFRAARGDTAGPAPSGPVPVVEPWDLHQDSLLSKEHLHSISQLHESFARNLTVALGGYLRDKFEVALVAVEQLAYQDFLSRFPEISYCCNFRLPPGEASGILHIDLNLAYPMVDLLLGGLGETPKALREVSEIEESILEAISRVICHELQLVWTPLGLAVEFERHQPLSQMLRIMPPREKTLTLTFDVTMTNSKGTLNVAFPAVVSSALLRKLGTELVYQRSRGPAVNQEGIRRRLLQSSVAMDLATSAIPVKLSALLEMRVGSILCLRQSCEHAARLRVMGRDCWLARPVASGRNRRAAQLIQSAGYAKEGENS